MADIVGFFHFLWRARSPVTARGLLKRSRADPGVLFEVVLELVVVVYGYGVLLEKVDHQPATGPGLDVLEIGGDGPRLVLVSVLILLSVMSLGLASALLPPAAWSAVGSCGPADVKYPYPKNPFGPKTIDIVPGLWPVDSRREDGTNPPTPTRPLMKSMTY